MELKQAEEIVKAGGSGPYRVKIAGKSQYIRLFYNDAYGLCVYKRRSHRRGFQVTYHDTGTWESLSPKESILNAAQRWKRSWQKVEKYLAASGFWKERLNAVRLGLEIGYEKIQQASKADHAGPYETCKERILAIDPRLTDTFLYWNMSRPAKVKAMYFSKFHERNARYRKQIAEAVAQKKALSVHDQASYDTTFEYKPFSEAQGGPAAWYSEEFRGCGNGHYYIALDGVHALFMEDD